jgi:hypothetical protein
MKDIVICLSFISGHYNKTVVKNLGYSLNMYVSFYIISYTVPFVNVRTILHFTLN